MTTRSRTLAAALLLTLAASCSAPACSTEPGPDPTYLQAGAAQPAGRP